MLSCISSFIFFFFFNDTATTEIYPLSLHDALPIYSTTARRWQNHARILANGQPGGLEVHAVFLRRGGLHAIVRQDRKSTRLNSSHSQISYAVFCLKKKKSQRGVTRAPPLHTWTSWY